MSPTWLIGIDDTDNATSIGTGRLARELAAHLEGRGLLTGPSITRHQFLVHRDIPYTSHNSSACIGAAAAGDAGEALLATARDFLVATFHTGANPGLCVCRQDAVPDGQVELALRAQREVLKLADFDAATEGLDAGLWWGGETGQGRIGATSGVALRARGEDGRFIGLPGIRALSGTLPVSDIIARSDVVAVETEAGEGLGQDVLIDTRDWVRPTLRGGRPVLVVCREAERWIPFERRSKDD